MESRPAQQTNHHEFGFTLIELLVVMLITAILIGLGVLSVQLARRSGQSISAISVAQAYADAADAYAREHGNRYPVFGDTNAWPAADAEKGPRDLRISNASTKLTYLRAVPESVQDGQVAIAASPQGDTPTIVYIAENSQTGYRIEVHVPGKDPCALRGGNATSSRPLSCSAR